jgi:hypothetical protein
MANDQAASHQTAGHQAASDQAAGHQAASDQAAGHQAASDQAAGHQAAGHRAAIGYEVANLPDEEYWGPATLRIDDRDVPVEIRASARFEPVEGRFRWAGRTAPDADLCERVSGGLRDARITIPGSPPMVVRLSEPDPWGGVRLSGIGTPPWFQ